MTVKFQQAVTFKLSYSSRVGNEQFWERRGKIYGPRYTSHFFQAAGWKIVAIYGKMVATPKDDRVDRRVSNKRPNWSNDVANFKNKLRSHNRE